MPQPVEPWSRVVRLSEKARVPEPVELTPDAKARAALAHALGLSELRKLRLVGELVPEGKRDWRLDAALGATVVQPCGVTLAPVTTRIDEAVTRRYLSSMPQVPEGDEIEMPEDDTAEPLPAALDLGGVMAEALALALPAFPRAAEAEPGDAVFAEPGVTPMTDEQARPFAQLKGLLGNDD